MRSTPRRIRQLKVAAIAALSVLALFAGCSTSTAPKPVESVAKPPPPPPSDLRVGMWLDFPPFAMKKDGEPQGAEVAFAEKIGTALGRRIRIVSLAWDDLIPALRDGRIDIIMSGMSVTEDRQRLVSFAEPYMRIGQMALVRTADEEKYSDPAAIDQKSTRIGFQADTTGEYFVRDRIKNAKLIGYPTIEKGIAALRQKKIDFFVHDAPTIWRITGGFGSKEKQLTGRYTLLTDEALAWAVRLEDADLRDRLSGLVEKWNADGELDVVLGRWIPVRKKKIATPPAAGS